MAQDLGDFWRNGLGAGNGNADFAVIQGSGPCRCMGHVKERLVGIERNIYVSGRCSQIIAEVAIVSFPGSPASAHAANRLPAILHNAA